VANTEKWSHEKAQAALDHICENGNVSAAARAIGVAVKTLYAWAHLSMADEKNGVTDSKFLLRNWLGTEETENEYTFYHSAFEQSRRIHALSIEQLSRALLHGQPRTVVEKGVVQYRKDPKLEAIKLQFDANSADDREEFETLTGRKWGDTYLRGKDGALIPLVVTDPIPAQFRIAALRSLFPQEWARPEERIETKTIKQTIEHVQKPETHRPQTPLIQDLELKLAQLKSRGPVNPRPSRPGDVIRQITGFDDPPDDVPLRKPQIPLDQHPRAHQSVNSDLTPPRPPRVPTGAARPDRGEQVGYGKPVPGGVRVR